MEIENQPLAYRVFEQANPPDMAMPIPKMVSFYLVKDLMLNEGLKSQLLSV